MINSCKKYHEPGLSHFHATTIGNSVPVLMATPVNENYFGFLALKELSRSDILKVKVALQMAYLEAGLSIQII